MYICSMHMLYVWLVNKWVLVFQGNCDRSTEKIHSKKKTYAKRQLERRITKPNFVSLTQLYIYICMRDDFKRDGSDNDYW